MSIIPKPLTPPTAVRRRWLFTLLRNLPFLLLIGLTGGLLLIFYPFAPRIGMAVIAGSIVGFFAWAYLMVYLSVLDRTRGQPEPQPCDRPMLHDKPAELLKEALSGSEGLAALGFEPAGWFFLDDVDQKYVGSWCHPHEPTVAYVLYFSDTEFLRVRFVRPLPDGGMLISTTRVTDLAYPPPPGMYVQMRAARSPADLYRWHREAERYLFGDLPSPAHTDNPHVTADRPASLPPSDAPRPEPVSLYVEWLERVAWHIRLKRFWLLRFGPVREVWREWELYGVSVRDQVEDGLAPPPPWRNTREEASRER